MIPPNKDMSILHGALHLFEPSAPRGLRLSIDFFFRSLADDRKEKSVGVILSGMGSDGTMGLRAIKEKAGLALVQEPASTKFDSMPRSAIDAGLADIVAADARKVLETLVFMEQGGRHPRWALVCRPHHALPHTGQQDRRGGGYLYRYYRSQDPRSKTARDFAGTKKRES